MICAVYLHTNILSNINFDRINSQKLRNFFKRFCIYINDNIPKLQATYNSFFFIKLHGMGTINICEVAVLFSKQLFFTLSNIKQVSYS